MHRFYFLRRCRPARLAALFTLLFAPGLRPAAFAQFTETQKITATPREAFNRFGRVVAIDGNTMAVAAYDRNKVVLFEKRGGTWQQTQLLLDPDPAARNVFGISLALEGTTLVVGDFFVETDANGANPVEEAGAAYVFEKVGGTWQLTQKLVADDRAERDRFGRSVALSGSTIAVGVLNADGAGGAEDVGSVYVFEKTGGTWQQTQKLVVENPVQADQFGGAVALSGNTLVVGAAGDESTDEVQFFDAGSVYVFEKANGTWQQTQRLVADDRAQYDSFGTDVDISGTTVLVGSPGNNAAYVFEKTGSTYSQTAKLVASDGSEVASNFGRYVAIDGDLALVGDYTDTRGLPGQDGVSSAGSAYLFGKSGGSWQQLQKLVPNARNSSANFGETVDLDGTTLVVGANGESRDVSNQNSLTAAGAVYVFDVCAPTFSSTPTVSGSPVCAGATFRVSFTAQPSGCATPVGLVAQLSDAMGSFANPVSLGPVSPGINTLTLPEGTPPGTGYRVRVVLETAPQVGSAASAPFRVSGPAFSNVPTVSGDNKCAGQAVRLSFATTGCPFPTGNTFTVELSDATGSNFTAIPGTVTPGALNQVVIPVGTPAGTGYKLRVVSSNPVGMGAVSANFKVKACGNGREAAPEDLGLRVVVSPNPSPEGRLRIAVSGLEGQGLRVELFNGFGQSLREQRLPKAGEEEIFDWDISRQPQGLYLLRVSGEKESKTVKLLH